MSDHCVTCRNNDKLDGSECRSCKAPTGMDAGPPSGYSHVPNPHRDLHEHDPSPIQVRDAAHYKAEVTCLNCGSETEVHPPAGTLVLEFTKEQKMVCPNCACVDARLVVKT